MEFIDNEFVIPGYVLELLDTIAQEKGLTNFTTTVTSDQDTEEGFMGVVARIKLQGVKVNQQIDIIAKLTPLCKARIEQTRLMSLFEREIHFYRDVLPDFVKFQEEKNIKPEEGFFNFPKFYGSYWDDINKNSVILLEDLTAQNYKLCNRLEPVDFEHTKLLMEQLGKFHAISLAMKDQEQKRFKKFTSLKDNLFVSLLENDLTKKGFEQYFTNAAETLEPSEEHDIEKMMKLKANYHDLFKSYDDTDRIEPFAVLTHGDCKINNMMYQYNETRTPVKVCLIDWQISRYTSPILDIVYFIFSATDKQLRTEHYQNLIKIYHQNLSQHLTRLGSDPEKLFSFNDLLSQLKQFGQFGLIMSAMVIPLLVTEAVDQPNMDEVAEQMGRGETVNRFMGTKGVNVVYKNRMSDIIRDIVRLDYL